MNKYILSLLLCAGIAGSCVIVSPTYAMWEEDSDDEEEKGIKDYARDCADGIMKKVGRFPMGGTWLANKYANHRDGGPYMRYRQLGTPVIFAEGAIGRNGEK